MEITMENQAVRPGVKDSGELAGKTVTQETAERYTLAAKYYVDETYFQKELEALFFSRWFCIGREEQIAKSGDFFLRDLGRESFIITRDEKGKTRGFFNVCRHRGDSPL